VASTISIGIDERILVVHCPENNDIDEVGGAMVKWPKYFLPQNRLKIGDCMRIGFIKMSQNFQTKKLTSRSLFGEKMAGKDGFTSEMQTCP
jgi:hypothetical protein